MLKAPLNSCVYINGKHTPLDKNITFSGYKKTQVFQQLKNSILKGEVDKACFWAAELDSSCYTLEIWNKIMIFACKEINYANPNLPTYLYKSYREFSRIAYNWTKKDMCNSQELRNRLCELICILSMSLKKKFPDYPRIKEDDFKIINMKKRMIANDLQLIQGIVNQNNTIEIRIALNEFANHLASESGSTDSIKNCLFWLDWIAYYNKIYKKNVGKELKCIQMCKNTDIDPKYKANFVWYVWDIIITVLNRMETRITDSKFNFLKKNIENLHALYKYEITKGNMNTRLIYVKYAILLMKKDIPLEKYENTPCFTNSVCIKACANVNDLYRYLLKNKQTYEYNKKEQELLTQIKQMPTGFMTDEDLAERVRINRENQQKETEISKYFRNKKYGREKLEEEMNRINSHNNTTNDRYMNNKRTAHSIYSLKERQRREKEKEVERQRHEYEKKSKRQTYKTNERIRQRKIRGNARRMYKNLR
jgi:hypothetical protein